MTVACLAHGPMKRREVCKWWVCVGFDGEGCGTQPVRDEDIWRGRDIPNVEVTP